MTFHKNLVDADIHVPFFRTYANATARLADTDFVVGDNNKIAHQESDDTFWTLLDFSGVTWKEFGATGATGAAGAPGTGAGTPSANPTVDAGATDTVVAEAPAVYSQVTFTLTNQDVSVLNPADNGEILLGNMGDRFWSYMGCTVDLSVAKDGVNILDTTDIYIGVGTGPSGGFPIAVTGEDLLHQIIYTDTADPVIIKVQEPMESPNGSSLKNNLPDFFDVNTPIYLNFAATPLSVTGTLTVTGTITLFILDMGAGVL